MPGGCFAGRSARGVLDHAPTDHLNTKDLIGAKKPRQRLLRDEELALIWRAAAQAPYPDGPYIQLLLLLGRAPVRAWASRMERDRSRPSAVDDPARRMKSDEGHTVPLPPRAVEILRAAAAVRQRLCVHCPRQPAAQRLWRGQAAPRSAHRRAQRRRADRARGRCTIAGGHFAPACRR